MAEKNQQQYGMNAQNQAQNEEVVEFKPQSSEIPKNVEFTADQKLEDKIEDNIENQNR